MTQELVQESKKFQDFKRLLDKKDSVIQYDDIDIQSVDYFGRRVGFVKCKVMFKGGPAQDLNNRPLPNIVFIRGAAIAVLIVVTVEEQKYILLCEQIRVPVGKKCLEICAGMADSDNNMVGVAFKEVQEETGITVNLADLIELRSIYPSPGGCDEEIFLYAYETSLTREEFNAKQRETFGCAASGESIRLVFVEYEKFDDVLDEIGDVKAECAWRRYQRILKSRR